MFQIDNGNRKNILSYFEESYKYFFIVCTRNTDFLEPSKVSDSSDGSVLYGDDHSLVISQEGNNEVEQLNRFFRQFLNCSLFYNRLLFPRK